MTVRVTVLRGANGLSRGRLNRWRSMRANVRSYLEQLPEVRPGPTGQVAILLIRAYQWWSHGKGRELCSYPRPNNCSSLGARAIAHHGLVMGTVLVIALLRNTEEGGLCKGKTWGYQY
jgi:putative component of membrane protein insertase Oxa1/YidC/SpoIIIJ protein YidD